MEFQIEDRHTDIRTCGAACVQLKKELILICLHKVFVPLTHDGTRGWIFDLVCPGYAMSVIHNMLLLLKNATVNWNLGFNDVCKKKHAIVAYNNYRGTFEVSKITGNMVEYPVTPYIRYWKMAREWEIQAIFFENNNIQPIWLNANNTWGLLNYTTGQWSGAVGMIQRDEADYAICCFGTTSTLSKVAAFSPTDYAPFHWLTRYPLELPPTWNLLGLFTKGYISRMSLLCKHNFNLNLFFKFKLSFPSFSFRFKLSFPSFSFRFKLVFKDMHFVNFSPRMFGCGYSSPYLLFLVY